MHRDGGGQCRQHQQGIEEHRHAITHNRHIGKRLVEDIRERDENQRRTTIWLDAHREGGREYHQTSQDGDDRINHYNLTCRLQEIGLSAEVRSVSTEARRTEAQREERLSERFEQHILIHLGEIRLQQELHALHRPWQ